MTIREIQYKTFSLRTHKKNWRIKRPNVCQFELTFACGLHCKYCYSDSYNRPEYLKKELDTQEVKFILDKVYQTGAIWLCFTGGDPLIRKDFLDIYSYAKNKGFIITIFTNACSMTGQIAKYLKRRVPFVIEITLNAVTEELYEKISQVKGSFKKAMQGIDLILRAKLPLEIKTQIIRDNLGEMPKIKKFIEGLGLKLLPIYDLHARLNNDIGPCNLRIQLDEISGRDMSQHTSDDSGGRMSVCDYRPRPKENLFSCAVSGGDGLYIDPYGNISTCNLIRKPALSLLKVDIGYAINKFSQLLRDRKFITDSKCNGCNLREFCYWCPAKAYIEGSDMETPIEYYCKLAHLQSSYQKAFFKR